MRGERRRNGAKLASRRDLAQNAAELVEIHRFCKVEIEASFSATLDVVTRCIAGYRHGFPLASGTWRRHTQQHLGWIFLLSDNLLRHS